MCREGQFDLLTWGLVLPRGQARGPRCLWVCWEAAGLAVHIQGQETQSSQKSQEGPRPKELGIQADPGDTIPAGGRAVVGKETAGWIPQTLDHIPPFFKLKQQ